MIQKHTNFNLLPNLTFYSVLSVSSVVKFFRRSRIAKGLACPTLVTGRGCGGVRA